MNSARRMQPWMLVSLAWLVPAIFAVINQVAQSRIHGYQTNARELVWAGGDWFLYALLTPGVFALSRRWPLVKPHLRRRIVFHFTVSLLFCIAWALSGKLLQLGLGFLLDREGFDKFIAEAGAEFWPRAGKDVLGWIFTTFPFGIAAYLCMVGIEHAIRYFTEARDREVQLAQVNEQLTSARMAALEARLNPHFLFNTLNTISVLVRDGDRTAATGMLEQLSEVLRRTLRRHQGSEVALEAELDLVRRYLSIEQARFSDRLRISYDIEGAALSVAVPSFALQHLVENAVRHGTSRSAGVGTIAVTAYRIGPDLILTVTDNGAGISDEGGALTGHGLENTRERLRALYGTAATLQVARADGGGTSATLRVPWRVIPPDAGRDDS